MQDLNTFGEHSATRPELNRVRQQLQHASDQGLRIDKTHPESHKWTSGYPEEQILAARKNLYFGS